MERSNIFFSILQVELKVSLLHRDTLELMIIPIEISDCLLPWQPR